MPQRHRAKLFRNGGSQAVRLPRECRFSAEEVLVHREGSRVILEPADDRWSPEFLGLAEGASDETMPARAQPARPDRRARLRKGDRRMSGPP